MRLYAKALVCLSSALAMTASASAMAAPVSVNCDPPEQNGKVRKYHCVVGTPCSNVDLVNTGQGVNDAGKIEEGPISKSTASNSSCHVSWTVTKKKAGSIIYGGTFSVTDGTLDSTEYEDEFTITQALLAMRVAPGQGDADSRTAMLGRSEHDLYLPFGEPVRMQLDVIDVESGDATPYSGLVAAGLEGDGVVFGNGLREAFIQVESGKAVVDLEAIVPGGASSYLKLHASDIEAAGVTITPIDGPVVPAGLDANGDGQLNTFDAILIVRKALGLDTPTGSWGDANGDGQVNVLDAVLAARTLPFAPSGQVCGDGLCETRETHGSCADDCEPPTLDSVGCIPGGPGVIALELPEDPDAPAVWSLDTNGDGEANAWAVGAEGTAETTLVAVDSDHDGAVDTWAIASIVDPDAGYQGFDTDGDGKPDAWGRDSDGDGDLDEWKFDLDKDGDVDAWSRDSDNDGKTDEWDYDTNGDGKPDAFGKDLDGDGKVDQWGFDTDGDGKPDVWLRDVNGDGKMDQFGWDTDGDGKPDAWQDLPPGGSEEAYALLGDVLERGDLLASAHGLAAEMGATCWTCLADELIAVSQEMGPLCGAGDDAVDILDLGAVIPADEDVLCVTPEMVELILTRLHAEPIGDGYYATYLEDTTGEIQQLTVALEVTDQPVLCSSNAKTAGDGTVDDDPGDPITSNDKARAWINAECKTLAQPVEISCRANYYEGPYGQLGAYLHVKYNALRKCRKGTGSCMELNSVRIQRWFYADNQCQAQLDYRAEKEFLCIP